MEKAKKVWDWYQSWFDAYPRGAAIAFLAIAILAVIT